MDGINSTGIMYQKSVITTSQQNETTKSGVEKPKTNTDSEDNVNVGYPFQTQKAVDGGTSTSANSNTGTQSTNGLEAMQKAVSKINKQNSNSIVQFGVHEETGRMTIKILDKDTKKVIKEFPAEKTLDLIAKAWEMAGILVDEKG